MTNHSEMHSNASEAQETRPSFDEKMLPELIQSQIRKLNELDAGVKKALGAAGKAEQRAKEAGKLSASFWSFSDQKKEAIEGLQKAGIELAEAVQLEVQAQKLSFEFQTRLAEITKHFFTLGVSNIAANRVVVRELEMRLRGASESELSELARQEVMSVIQQLKEQEDLLRKQEQMRKELSGHDSKIKYLLDQTDDLGFSVRNQDDQHRAMVSMIDSMGQVLKQQQEEILALQKQVFAQRAELETLTTALTQAGSYAEQATESLRSALNLRTALLVIWAMGVSAAVYFLQ